MRQLARSSDVIYVTGLYLTGSAYQPSMRADVMQVTGCACHAPVCVQLGRDAREWVC